VFHLFPSFSQLHLIATPAELNWFIARPTTRTHLAVGPDGVLQSRTDVHPEQDWAARPETVQSVPTWVDLATPSLTFALPPLCDACFGAAGASWCTTEARNASLAIGAALGRPTLLAAGLREHLQRRRRHPVNSASMVGKPLHPGLTAVAFGRYGGGVVGFFGDVNDQDAQHRLRAHPRR
jgi:hypothetical protein